MFGFALIIMSLFSNSLGQAFTGADVLKDSRFQRRFKSPSALHKSNDLFELEQGHLRLVLKHWEEAPSPASVGRVVVHGETIHMVPKTILKLVDTYKESLFEKTSIRKFLNRILPLLEQKGHSASDLRKMRAKELLELSADFIIHWLTYVAPVNRLDPNNPNPNPIFYFDLRQGVCSQFRDLTAMTFYALVQFTGNQENLFVLKEDISTRAPEINHAWLVALTLGTNGTWYFSHLDPTFLYSHSNKVLDATDDYHVGMKTWRYKFYDYIGSYLGVIDEFRHDSFEGDTESELHFKLQTFMMALTYLGWLDEISMLPIRIRGQLAVLPPGFFMEFTKAYKYASMYFYRKPELYSKWGKQYLKLVEGKKWTEIEQRIRSRPFSNANDIDQALLDVLLYYPDPKARELYEVWYKRWEAELPKPN